MAEHQISKGSNQKMEEKTNVAVVVVPIPGQGHLNQGLHLSRIISSNKIPIYFVSTPNHNRQAKLRSNGWDPLTNSYFHFHDVEIPIDALHEESNTSDGSFSMAFSVLFLRQPIYTLMNELAKTSKRVVLVVDYFIYWIIQDFSTFPKSESWECHSFLDLWSSVNSSNVYSIPNAEIYIFHSISAFSMYYLERTSLGKPVLVHGKAEKNLPPKDCAFSPEFWVHYTLVRDNIKNNHGNLYNSCKAIEGEFLDLLAEEKLTNADKHWPIGPINPVTIPERKTSNKYLEWLGKQQPKSVIFVSFGTTITFSYEQVKEIAMGLERSGQNFMWVLRDADRANIFEGESRKIQLPEGFEERVEGRGIVIRDWAPQLEILGHPSTGGFISHCGWNSCIESISMGVPIAAWPMYFDQPMNAFLITQVLQIGIMVKGWTLRHEIVKSETIEEVVKRLMASQEGNEMRQRAAELSTAVKQSLKEDGATTAEIASLIAHFTR